MRSDYLEEVADRLEAEAGIITPANEFSDTGRWLRIAKAAEEYAGSTTQANVGLTGYMLRTAVALEKLSGTSGAEENVGETGYLKRISDALDALNATSTTASTDIRHRFWQAGRGATLFGGGHVLAIDFTKSPHKLRQVRTRTNLLTYSQEFDNAAWSKVAGGTGVVPVVTANYGTAPDGTATADRIMFDRGAGLTSADESYIQQSPPSTIGAQSIYLKTNDGSTRTLHFRGTTQSATIAVTGEWQRFELENTSASTLYRLSFIGSLDSGSATADILAWGAQLEAAPKASAYIPTTTAAASVTENYYTASPLRTNLFLRSQEFDNASWSKAEATVTANAGADPNEVTTADKLIPSTVSSNSHVIFQSVTVGGPVTFSVYAKADGYSRIMLFANGSDQGYGFDLSAGTTFAVGGITAATGATITSVGSGWYRCSVPFPSVTRADIYVLNSTSYVAFAGDGTSGVQLWGAQMEQGSIATAYIPTTSAIGLAGGISDAYGYTYTRNGGIKQEIEGAGLGPELVTNGTFTTDTSGWTANASTLSVSNGRMRVTSTSASTGKAEFSFPTVAGRQYNFSAKLFTGNQAPRLKVGSTPDGLDLISTVGADVTTTFIATGTTAYVTCFPASAVANEYAEFDDITCKEYSVEYSHDGASYLGDELLESPSITGAGWSSPYGGSASGDVMTFSGQFHTRLNSVSTVSGRTYEFSATIRRISGNTALHLFTDGSPDGATHPITISDTAQRFTVRVRGGTSTDFGVQDRNASGHGQAEITNVTVREVIPEAFESYPANVPGTVPGLGYWSRAGLTNQVIHSQNVPGWTLSSVTATANTVLAPDGTLTADTVDEGTASTNHYGYTSAQAVTDGATYTQSCFLKMGTCRYVAMRGETTAASTFVWALFDLQDGLIAGNTSNGTATIKAVGNGWYHCTLTWVQFGTVINSLLATNSNATCPATTDTHGQSFTGTSRTFHAWQMQLVAGPQPGPVILTTTAAASVGEDNLSTSIDTLTDKDMLVWVKAKIGNITSENYFAILTDGTANERVDIYTNSTGNAAFYIFSGAAVRYNASASPAPAVDDEVTFVLRRSGGNWRGGYVKNGALTWAGADTAGTFPTGLNKINVGNYLTGTLPAKAPIAFAGIRPGTFSTDADVIAAVSAA